MYLNFSKLYNLPISGHRDIMFVDVPCDTDIPLYCDPDRIMHSSGIIADLASAQINDFFDVLMDRAAQRDIDQVYSLLSFGHEPNETHLGFSQRVSNGRGVSAEILIPIIKDMIRLGLFDYHLVKSPSDLHLLTPNFGPDRLSDLVTNVIRASLHAFTRMQFDFWNIPYNDSYLCYELPAWDTELHQWTVTQLPIFPALGKPILLTPKSFVGTALLSSPEQILQKYALGYAQTDHFQMRSALCPVRTDRRGNTIYRKPSKRDVRRWELRDCSCKKYIRDQALIHPEMLPSYRQDIFNRALNANVFMSDSDLDKLLYPSFVIPA